MNIKSFLTGGALASLLFLAIGCGEGAKNEIPEKVSVEFAVAETTIPVNGTTLLEIKVTPASRADEVIVTVADESVVSIESQQNGDEGISLVLKAQKLSSTTIYAIHDDLESPAECAVAVTPVGVESVTLDQTSLSLKVFDTYTLSPTISPDDATSPVLIWKSDNEQVATVDNGAVTAVSEGEATISVTCNGHTAECAVSVYSIKAESLTLSVDGAAATDKEINVGEAFKIDAQILPSDVTYKTVNKWTVSNPEIIKCEPLEIDGNTESAYITALAPGEATVTAKITNGSDGKELTASFKVAVKTTEVPQKEPRIGDYFYSDGTWSDGGLVSINADGTNAVWLTGDKRPAPVEGKTVIGIVFQTASDRISETEKALGYTHGLVLSLKRAYKPIALKDPNNKYETPDSLTKFTTLSEVSYSCVKRGTLATSYYNDISGYSATKGICSLHPGDEITTFPAIDWITRGFTAAPAKTSGWYLPSSGQVWDILANLGGNEIAEYLKTLSGYEGDISYYDWLYTSYDPVAELNSHWSKVPASMKENMHGDRSRSGYDYFMFLCCGQYDTESCRVFWIGSAQDKNASKKGQFAGYLTWLDDAVTCYPILSF